MFETKFNQDQPIYRIVSWDRLRASFVNSRISLSNPSLWLSSDPFECYVLNSNHQLMMMGEYHSYPMKDFLKVLYGQSWSLVKDSDAMWRLYGKGGQGVRIKTTANSILAGLGKYESNRSLSKDLLLHIGAVNYMSEEEIDEEVLSIDLERNGDNGVFELLLKPFFIKRDSFRHEEEVRFAILDKRKQVTDQEIQPILELELSPMDYVDEICYDPRSPLDDFDQRQQELLDLGYSGELTRSDIYNTPKYSFYYSGVSNKKLSLNRVERNGDLTDDL